MKTEFFAIRHKPTGHYLPEHGSRKGRGGYTNDEPDPNKPPRMFASKHHAESALIWWLKGIVGVSYHYDSYDGDYDEIKTMEPMPHRKAEDMEIVPVRVRVSGPIAAPLEGV